MTRANSYMRILPGAFLMMAIGACGSESSGRTDAEKAKAEAPKDPAAAAGAAAEKANPSAEEEEYVYNPISKRDPFRTFIAQEEKNPVLDPTPLQKYEIDQYRLTGIIWGIERPRALVEDPEGVGHVVELGTYIGRNWGKVSQITSSDVVITEEYMTPDGSLVLNPVTMSLTEVDKDKKK